MIRSVDYTERRCGKRAIAAEFVYETGVQQWTDSDDRRGERGHKSREKVLCVGSDHCCGAAAELPSKRADAGKTYSN
jgi:hypothetical protein